MAMSVMSGIASIRSHLTFKSLLFYGTSVEAFEDSQRQPKPSAYAAHPSASWMRRLSAGRESTESCDASVTLACAMAPTFACVQDKIAMPQYHRAGSFQTNKLAQKRSATA